MLALMIAAATVMKAQDNPPEYLGLPGDNLNLYAVMKTFQESKTLEDFEKSINDPANRINNLDLNGDNYVDYIMVIDNVKDDVHYIVLRVAINRNENQDVAVFTVQRFSNGEVQIQLTGDVALYGNNYIIEPIYDENNYGTPNPGYTGDNVVVYGRKVSVVRTTPVIIASWPVIRYIYAPDYYGWHSHWYWDYYPTWWNPWRPFYWHYYYGYHYNWYNDYYCHYRRWDTHRYSHWDDHYYHGSRVYSQYVSVNINNGHYRNTYGRPETRKDGEQAYNSQQPAQGRRTSYSTVSATPSRNTGTGNDNVNKSRRVTSGNIASSRTNNEVANRNSYGDSRTLKDADAGSSSRRMASTVTSRTMSDNRPAQNTVSNSRSSTVNRSEGQSGTRTLGNNKPAQNPGSVNRSAYQAPARNSAGPVKSQNVNQGRSSERSSSQTVSRSVSAPQNRQSVSSGRSSGQQVKSESVAPSRRSSGNSQPQSSAARSNDSGKSESSGSSRRK